MTLNVHGLGVRRSTVFSLDIAKLTVKPGELLCITGPNGSGKTTLIECLTGLLQPEHGTVTLDAQPVSSALQPIRAAIGYAPDDEHWLIAALCADEYFGLLQSVYRKAGVQGDLAGRTAELAARLYFTSLRQPLGTLSHGNKKKVQLIAALLHRPRLVVIDELRNGLDPLAIQAAEAVIREALQTGGIVVAATHDLWWAERIAGTVLMLHHGTIAAYGATTELTMRYGSLESLFMAVTKEGNGHDAN